MSKLSSTELSTLKSLLQRANQHGNIQQYAAEVNSVYRAIELEESLSDDQSDFQCVTPTSMTDASKRRLTEASSPCHHMSQVPVTPSRSSEDSFPPGITSLEMWGSTVVEFGKFKDRQMSYAEMMNEAKSDSSVKSYLDWVRHHTSSSSQPPLKDLHAYVKVMDRKLGNSNLMFPGSNTTRKLKATA